MKRARLYTTTEREVIQFFIYMQKIKKLDENFLELKRERQIYMPQLKTDKEQEKCNRELATAASRGRQKKGGVG